MTDCLCETVNMSFVSKVTISSFIFKMEWWTNWSHWWKWHFSWRWTCIRSFCPSLHFNSFSHYKSTEHKTVQCQVSGLKDRWSCSDWLFNLRISLISPKSTTRTIFNWSTQLLLRRQLTACLLTVIYNCFLWTAFFKTYYTHLISSLTLRGRLEIIHINYWGRSTWALFNSLGRYNFLKQRDWVASIALSAYVR